MSPFHQWTAGAPPMQMVCSTQRADDPCQQSDAMARHADAGELLVAGGGAFNPALLQRLQALNPRWTAASTAAHGIPPERMEAVAFAVFAQRTMDGLTGNLPAVTGASRPCVLGGIYPP